MKPTATCEFPIVRELAAMLVSMRKVGIGDRGLVVRLLRSAMERHPEYLGLWCVFEPDAFDGRDQEFANRKGHDATGRFAPRWHRNHGRLRLECCYGHDSPTLGGWYFLARDSRQELVFGPYDEHLLTGLPVLCLSRVAPILEGDRFIGAVGVDIALDSLEQAGEAEASPGNPPLEELFERWHVFLKDNGEIEFASRPARRLLRRHVGFCRRGRLPASLNERLAAAEAVHSPLHFTGPQGELRITVVRHPHTGRRILSLEPVSPLAHRPMAGAGISAREQEVLEWLEQGKSNGEIAVILGISEHTVRHHLERIFGKLGVENRRAATLCNRQSRRVSTERLLSRIPLPGAPKS